MSIMDFFKAPSIKKDNERMLSIINEMGAGDAIIVKKKIEELLIVQNDLIKKCEALDKSKIDLENIIEEKRNQIIVLDEDLLLESFALYKPKYHFLTSDEYKNKLEIIRSQQKQLIKDGRATEANQDWVVGNSRAKGKKVVNDMIKLLLRSFNNECDYCVDNVKFNNIETYEKRIEHSYQTLNKLGEIMQVKVTDQYKKLKFDELYLAFEYQQKKQEEKEEQKRLREELREQQKLEQEIKQARDRILKEKKHFTAAMKELEAKILITTNEGELKLINDRINEINDKFNELEKEEKVIDYREQNAKAGYVYIISNVGSFGENKFKIGMTRRLEPMERIDELGDASVPFPFDVHALIFSDNAPALESKLHEHFYASRLNKINDRKEFFEANINEIEKIVKENYDKVIDIMKEAPAEQYRKSLLI